MAIIIAVAVVVAVVDDNVVVVADIKFYRCVIRHLRCQ